MIYQKSKELLDDVRKVYSDAEVGASRRYDILWGLYQNAAAGTSCHYIGLLKKRGEWFGQPGSYPHAMHALASTLTLGDCLVSCQVQPGYVLVMHDDDWCIAANDAWMLGGIHAGKHYMLMADPVSTQDETLRLLGDIMLPAAAGAHPLSVTGREILGLIFYGYRLQAGPGGHLRFLPHSSHGQDATFSAYRQGIRLTEEKLRATTERAKRLSVIRAELAKLGLSSAA